MNRKVVSAATVTYFSELGLIKSLLDSVQLAAELLHAETGYEFEYYIVDNSDDDDYFCSLEKLCAEIAGAPNFRLLVQRAPGNLGYGGGNNHVLDAIQSCYHLVINPDVTIARDSLCVAVAFMNEHLDVAMLTPKVANGVAVKHVAKSYPDCLTLLLRYLNKGSLNRYFKERLGRYQCDYLGGSVDKRIELAGGCFLFIRTQCYQQLRGFDEHFFMYFEDFDLSIRVRKTHGKIAYVPSVVITHQGGFTARKVFRHHWYFACSAVKFFCRHGWRLW